MELTELKKQLATVRGGKRSRYPAKLKQAVLAYAAKRRTQKASRETVAAELEMSIGTLSYWCALAGAAGACEPVTIVAAQPTNEVVNRVRSTARAWARHRRRCSVAEAC